MKPAALCLAALVLVGGAFSAEARQAYCYSTVMPSGDKLTRALTPATIYVSPVFQSDDDVYLLQVMFQQTVPEGGLASCVTDEDEPDLAKDWQDFINSAKADGSKVEMKPAPPEYSQ